MASNGDPLEAATVVAETVRLVRCGAALHEQQAISFRLNTLGLCDPATVETFFATVETSSALTAGSGDGGDGGKASRIAGVSMSVFLPAADSAKCAPGRWKAVRLERNLPQLIPFSSRSARMHGSTLTLRSPARMRALPQIRGAAAAV